MIETLSKIILECEAFKKKNDELIAKCLEEIKNAELTMENADAEMERAAIDDNSKTWDKAKNRKVEAKKKIDFYNARKIALEGSGHIDGSRYLEMWREIEKELAHIVMRQREIALRIRAEYDEEMKKEKAAHTLAIDALLALNNIADPKECDIVSRSHVSRFTMETYLNSVMVPMNEIDLQKTHLPQLKKAVSIIGAELSNYTENVPCDLSERCTYIDDIGTNENKREQMRTNENSDNTKANDAIRDAINFAKGL